MNMVQTVNNDHTQYDEDGRLRSHYGMVVYETITRCIQRYLRKR